MQTQETGNRPSHTCMYFVRVLADFEQCPELVLKTSFKKPAMQNAWAMLKLNGMTLMYRFNVTSMQTNHAPMAIRVIFTTFSITQDVHRRDKRHKERTTVRMKTLMWRENKYSPVWIMFCWRSKLLSQFTKLGKGGSCRSKNLSDLGQKNKNIISTVETIPFTGPCRMSTAHL